MGADFAWLRSALAWGGALWLFGYVLGFLFYAAVPPSLIGWFVTPLALAATVYVLRDKLPPASPMQAARLGLIWSLTAIALDYVLIVRLLNPPDGYYKLDVFLYYGLTFGLPFAFVSRRRPPP